MTRKEYLKIKDILDAWSNGKTIGLATNDNKNILDGFRDVNPLEHYKSKRMVINDEYLELRLAIMRGERIEYKNRRNEKWVKLSSSELPTRDFAREKEEYRIEKPDITWIEDGAFCRDKSNGRVYEIYIDEERNVGLVGCTAIDINAFVGIYEKWEPISKDLCWFWDNWDDNEDSCENLPKLLEFHDEVLGKFRAKELADTHYDHCNPYIGKKFWE